jgi:hypothetical protein
MIRLSEKLEKKLVTHIEALRMIFPGTTTNSVADKEDLKFHGASISESVSGRSRATAAGGPMPTVGLGEGIGITYNRVPLTKESLDLMDTPVPSGVLAEEFAYHGLAPSFLKEMHQARELLDEIYTEIKRYCPFNQIDGRNSQARKECIAAEFQIAFDCVRCD